ncbi:unnamed protein product [Dicrocoelium dendriticum]|nr:unnamed protein product [Dicrocoelium dendriticum]
MMEPSALTIFPRFYGGEEVVDFRKSDDVFSLPYGCGFVDRGIKLPVSDLETERSTEARRVFTKKETSDLEAKVKHELSHLLNVLDSANAQRRQLLRSLSPTSIRPRPSPSSATDGVPV